jgi:DNA-directed RNA polymerase subunit RPC12/RpoP
MDTIYVCSKCGTNSRNVDNLDDWLIAKRPNHPGELVIRCPDCITVYAVRKAGGKVRGDTATLPDGWECDLTRLYYVQPLGKGRTEYVRK